MIELAVKRVAAQVLNGEDFRAILEICRRVVPNGTPEFSHVTESEEVTVSTLPEFEAQRAASRPSGGPNSHEKDGFRIHWWDADGSASVQRYLNSDDISIRVRVATEQQARDFVRAMDDALKLVPGKEEYAEDERRELDMFANRVVDAAAIRDAVEMFKAHGPFRREVYYTLARDAANADERVIPGHAPLDVLDDPAFFKTQEMIRGEFQGPAASIFWEFWPVTSGCILAVYERGGGQIFARLKEELGERLNLVPVSHEAIRYRSGTLTYKMGSWSPAVLVAGIDQVARALPRLGLEVAPGQKLAPPKVTDAYVTREAKKSERLGGPAEVLEPCADLAEFRDKVQDPAKTLRAISISLEGSLRQTFNLSANLRDNQIEIWGNIPLKTLQNISEGLTDNLKLDLIDGRPGVSLEKSKPGAFDKIEKQVKFFGSLVTSWVALATALGIGFTGGFTLFILGWSSVSVTHPVKNGETFEASPAQALVLDWKLSRPWIRKLIDATGSPFRLSEDVNVKIYRNGEILDTIEPLADGPVAPGVAVPLEAGKYRIDFDHPDWMLHDATIFVTVAPEKSAAAE